MTGTLTPDVTAALIAEGVRDSCTACPVAAAVYGAVPGSKGVVVTAWAIAFTGPDGTRYRSPTPPGVPRFMERFDAGLPVAPFAFTLTPFAVSGPGARL